MKFVWRRLKDFNLKLPEELIVLMTLTGLPPSFGTILYTSNLEQGSLDADVYVKSMEPIWRRLNEFRLKLPQNSPSSRPLWVFSIFRDPKKNSGVSKNPSMEIIKKYL